MEKITSKDFNRQMRIFEAVLLLAEERIIDLTEPRFEAIVEKLDKMVKENIVISK